MAHEPSSPSSNLLHNPANLSDSGLDYSSDLNNKRVFDGIITGFGSEQVSIDAMNTNNPNLGSSDMDDEELEKVKFLCSYNGKIMPRPSDGMLRYVGGQTRIISVKRNVRFDEFKQKMIQVYGQPVVVIKYQLPDEDLDALVSVSSSEDIDNMMDEFDKLVERSSDGSGKLRVFLFDVSSSEVDDSFGDGVDIGQRYVEAVNGVVVSKESVASGSSSNPNSDFSGVDVVDSLGVGQSDFVATTWTSSNFSPHTYHSNSPRLVPPEPRSSAYVLPMTVQADPFHSSQLETVSGKQILGKIQQQQQVHDLQQSMTTPSEHHSPTYVESRQEALRQPDVVHSPIQLLPSSTSLFSQQPFQGSTVSVSSHQFLPASHMSMAPLNAQIGATPVLINPVLQTQENLLGNYPAERNVGIQKVAPLPTEPRYTAYQGTIAPGLPIGGCGGSQVPPSNYVVLPDGGLHQQVIMPESFQRVDDCHMCQTSFPHMHSDLVIRERNDGSTMSVPYVRSAFHASHPDDIMRVETTEPFLNEIVRDVPIKVQVSRQQQHPVDPSVAYAQYRELSGLVDDVNIHAPGIYSNCQSFISPVDKIGTEDIMGTSSQQMARKNMLSHDTSGQSPLSQNIDHTDSTKTLTRVVLPGHESQPKASLPPTQSPLLGNPGLYLQSLVGGQQFDSVEAQSSNPAYDVVESTFDAANLPSSLSSNPDAANLPSSLSSSVGGADHKDSSKSLFSNQDPWNLQTNSKEDVKPDLLSSSKGSEEEHIKQELRNVAEGVAASVLQSSTSSYLEPTISVDEYPSNSKGEVSRNDEMKQQSTTQFKNIRNQLLERLNFGYSGSDSLDQLQIIKDSDLEELRELGSGTFGTVYHGKWRGTDVAIKRINDRCFTGKPSEQERMIDDFWNEAQTLAGLHHPNVVAFYGVVLDSPGGSVATVTEYMVNGSLRNALQKNVRKFDRRKRLLIAMDIAFGMEYLHGKKIVHFDLKSDNLLVNLRDLHRPICKVGDLGLSKVKCQTLISGGVRGTLPWMAPELLNGISSLVSEKVDVFSFGIVLWELFTGEEPYTDLHYGAIIGGIVSNTLRPQIPNFCDMDWKLLMERCWSAEPSERPSFTEIVNELRTMATKLPSKEQGSTQGAQS
ncbi:Protein kinase domain [Arabidopsis thaliana x Arabidopsis arenosa]|uniref:Protein kinase domain n=1 Tax=Arabidopsis thaliana x Arabidopsis arenosa TaxID=1240361 RepID=A0A8T1ZL93_9BRAS|nr:Protein kinase domain [Arabidopsis thaliana x Arabidopsis arenosa]